MSDLKVFLAVFLYLFLIYFDIGAQQKSIELKNNYFYINGKKFFIKGIGYEVGAVPGQVPYNRKFDEKLLRFDMQRIENAGFNTIRTWAPFTNEELNVIKDYKIKIIMGIWVDPAGKFDDPVFISNAKKIVNEVLSYSKNYNNIIAYLIMNEPLPETIFKAGYGNTVLLWKALIQIIHEKHPGVPVTIANTCTGDYIDPAIFDFSAYNVYIYNPVTVNFTHGYPAYTEYLNHLRDDGKPLIITEYGLSVSPNGPGGWGYGGNTLSEQEQGIIYMYRSLIDGGASGSCVFNYSDGWWKSGNEKIHEDNPEEWFGLIEYNDLNDKYGKPRMAWDSVIAYQRAIITSPVNSGIYKNTIPIEIFTLDTVKSVKIFANDRQVYEKDINDNYLIDSILIDVIEISVYQFRFLFFNHAEQLVKQELISFLTTPGEINLPKIEIKGPSQELGPSGTLNVEYQYIASKPFSTDGKIKWAVYPHIGFDYGTGNIENFDPGLELYQFTKPFKYGISTNVITCAAGIDVFFGGFKKRIYNQITMVKGNVIDGISNLGLLQSDELQIFPNPASEHFQIYNSNCTIYDVVDYKIVNIYGKTLLQGKVKNFEYIYISGFPKGIYFVIFKRDKEYTFQIKRFIIL